MFSSTTGIIHFIASIIALITGTFVLGLTKGTQKHKRIGYVYAIAMLILLITSFMIYQLHGRFGILHIFAVISSIVLLAGIVPMIFKRPKEYFVYHFNFMYWSVIGLYCAFFAEIFTRIPFWLDLKQNIAVIFYAIVGITTAAVGGIGSKYFKKYKSTWENMYKAH